MPIACDSGGGLRQSVSSGQFRYVALVHGTRLSSLSRVPGMQQTRQPPVHLLQPQLEGGECIFVDSTNVLTPHRMRCGVVHQPTGVSKAVSFFYNYAIRLHRV